MKKKTNKRKEGAIERNVVRASRVNATIKSRTLSLGVNFTACARQKTGVEFGERTKEA